MAFLRRLNEIWLSIAIGHLFCTLGKSQCHRQKIVCGIVPRGTFLRTKGRLICAIAHFTNKGGGSKFLRVATGLIQHRLWKLQTVYHPLEDNQSLHMKSIHSRCAPIALGLGNVTGFNLSYISCISLMACFVHGIIRPLYLNRNKVFKQTRQVSESMLQYHAIDGRS